MTTDANMTQANAATDAGSPMPGDVLWAPDSGRDVPMRRFMRTASERAGTALEDYRALHAWSVNEPAAFWDLVWDEAGVIGEKGGAVLEGSAMAPDADDPARFFPRARLSFAENLLAPGADGDDALVFRSEDKARARVTRGELRAMVARLQRAMRAAGVGTGDRVAAMLPNAPETVALMLAANALGAVWSSCSPDFGPRGVLDRFGQIGPKLFFACEGYWYAGKWQDIGGKLAEIVPQLGCPLVVVPYPDDARPEGASDAGSIAARLDGRTLAAFAAAGERGGEQGDTPTFERLPFDHPLYILFSSGTTGVPKCIVHGQGGTLLQHLKEHRLHAGVEPGDRVFFFTTCGWMMWNWLVSGLAAGATLMLYDGSPFHPAPEVLFDYAAEERWHFFGTSAKFIDAARKAGLTPRETHDLGALRGMGSTGSPLAPEGFRWVYEAIKPDLHLASMSGGTDIVSCFVLGVPTEPVRVGEIQGPGLGMAVDVWDETRRPVVGEKGELVCTKPFPSQPIGFWNDADGARYRAAYFDTFPGVWAHGDFAEWTPSGGMVIHGRSDATLNPQGVRIGTAEIYAQVETMPEIAEALAIGQDWEGDVRVVLFVRLAPDATLDEALEKAIKARIRSGASPRHVPARIVAVADIPRTKSGKIVELAVREVVHGRPVKNVEALANPEALRLFEGLDALAT